MAAVGTGVTIGSRTIRVLEVRKDKAGKWQVTKALIAPLPEAGAADAQRVAEARSALATARAKGRTLVGLSGKDLIIRYTQVPPVPDWRLEMLMNFEIQEVSEQSGGDVSAAYAQLGIDDATSGDNVVLVALAKNGHLVPRLQALKAAGLDVLGGCPRAVAAFWVYKENGKLASDETVFMMHIGHENTDVAIARKGILIFARNVTGGSKLFTDALVQTLRLDAATAEKSKITKGNLTPRGKAKYRDSAEEKVANALMAVGGHFVSAFNSSLMFAKAQTKVPDCQPTRLVLMGSGAQLRGLPEYLESSLAIPVELFDPIPELDLSPLSEQAQNALKQDQGGIAVTLGLAQMAADEAALRVEILPESDRKKRRFLQHTSFSIAAAVVLFASVIVAWTMMAGAAAKAKDEKAVLDAKQLAFDDQNAQFQSAKNRVVESNEQKAALRKLVALGPAWQQVSDIVHSVLNAGADPSGQGNSGYDEIHLLKASARFDNKQITLPNGDQGFEKVPLVEFEAQVKNIGSRSASDAYTNFVNNVRERALATRGSLEPSFGDLKAQTNTFKFSVQQVRTPEDVAADATAAAGEEKR